MRKSQESLAEIFGTHVFSDAVMQLRLPKNIFARLRQTIELGIELDPDVAEVVAAAMKDWAVELGATHYSHWFSPMRGVTAEKHDSFISPNGDGRVILEFSGKELLRGESDASSFPSGGLRATFEARGYTAWDCTSPAFIKEDPSGTITLCVPTAFCSYNGEALDAKTPLMRSMDALNQQAVRVLHALGLDKVTRVTPSVGVEQEYFLVDKKMYARRPDLIFCGRTLVGSPPPKGQEMHDQYYSAIRPRVSCFMAEVNEELWRLGVPAKTQHNEAAPAQHELAVVYATANIAIDHNQLVMELLRKVADRHGFVCLLHEKPFLGIAGSGKHNNWSMSTDTGLNLLSPVKDGSNLIFCVFFMAVLAAVDEYAPLLRRACAQLSNDARLGAHEAPPTVISVYVGDEMMMLLEHLESGEMLSAKHRDRMHIGPAALPHVRKDTTDRNRTSPFAFTGNKFEFRMPGSSMQVADVNTTLNTIVAEVLMRIADRLEPAKDAQAECLCILTELAAAHKRIVYNGNNYPSQWVEEAERRGLCNLPTTVDAIPALGTESSVRLFANQGVFTKPEIESRINIDYEAYINASFIEVRTMLQMTRTMIIPYAVEYGARLCRSVADAQSAGFAATTQRRLADRVQLLLDRIAESTEQLEEALASCCAVENLDARAQACLTQLQPAMAALRGAIDELESIRDQKDWPLPVYGELLFCQDL